MSDFSKIQERKRGFTLVQLLVSLAIILILISISIPAISKIRGRANSVHCASNLRQIHSLLLLYGNEHRGVLPAYWVPPNPPERPQSAHWFRVIVPDEKERAALLRCPSAEGFSGWSSSTCYGMNEKVTSSVDETTWRIARVVKPSDKILFGDAIINPLWGSSGAGLNMPPTGSEYSHPAFREGGSRANFVFIDGHVEALKLTELNSEMFELYEQ